MNAICSTCGKAKHWWEKWSTGQCDHCYLTENAPELLARMTANGGTKP